MNLELEGKQYDISFIVKLSVEAATSEEAERRAQEWIKAALRRQEEQDPRVCAGMQPVNLSEIAVRVLNQIGEERRRADLPVS